ncbi:MAG: rRNA maturation RNase YbeY [Candidatus Kapaibacterium sp.]
MNTNIEIDIYNASSLPRVPRAAISDAITRTCSLHRCRTARVSVVLVNDRRIRAMNVEFLNHDYATDVITFPLDDEAVDGEIYISVETAARQANEYNVSFKQELLRLVIHGVLHLLGFDDATPELREGMHQEENRVLEALEKVRAQTTAKKKSK